MLLFFYNALHLLPYKGISKHQENHAIHHGADSNLQEGHCRTIAPKLYKCTACLLYTSICHRGKNGENHQHKSHDHPEKGSFNLHFCLPYLPHHKCHGKYRYKNQCNTKHNCHHQKPRFPGLSSRPFTLCHRPFSSIPGSW